jgi:MFS family permease
MKKKPVSNPNYPTYKMLKEYKSIIKNRFFDYIWISQIFSQLTINIMNFVLLTRLFEVTGSAISTSLLWVAYALPAILIGPFASGIIDLVDKRKILIATNLLQAMTIFLFALSSHLNIFVIYEVVFIYSLLNQFYVPSEASTLPIVLKGKNLAHGNSLFFITQQGSIVLGFAAAGILRSLFGFKETLFLCSGLLLVAFISTTFLPKIKPDKSMPEKFEDAFFGFFNHIKDGYNFIKNERKVLTPVLLLIGFQVALQLCIVQFPILAKNILSIPLNAASLYILVPAGIGAIIGALTVPKMLKKDTRKKTVIDTSLLLVAFSLLIVTFVAPLFGHNFKTIISFLMFIVLGYGFVGVVIPSQTFLQESTPDDFRGRVFGNFTFMVIVTSVLPVLFSGTIVEVFGIRFLLFILSMFVIGVFIVSKKFGDKFLTG